MISRYVVPYESGPKRSQKVYTPDWDKGRSDVEPLVALPRYGEQYQQCVPCLCPLHVGYRAGCADN
jgi:hypothetical protein